MSAKGYYTANQIIDEALAGVRDFNRNRYEEAAMYFGSGYRDFRLFQDSGSIKESWETITDINTVNYPKDAERIVAVGIVKDKELFTFTEAKDMVSPITSPIDASLDSDREEDETLYRTPTSGYAAKGVNVEYYYKDDRKKRRIVLGRAAVDLTRFADSSEVLLRFVSNDMDNLDTLYIPNEAANLLISYIEYKLVQSMPEKYDRAYRFDKKENYHEAMKMYEALELPSLQELADMIYETSGQSVRRL